MERRRFLSSVSGLAAGLSGYRGVGAAERASARIGVVGAGMIGASIALHLARRGAEVVVFEREGPAAGATGKSFAWINATWSKRPRSYFELNWAGVRGWRRLEAELGGALEVRWGGSLQYWEDPERASRLNEQLARHQRWGYPAHPVDAAEFARLEPGLDPEGPVLAAAFSSAEGTVDPVSANRALLRAAEAAGAKVVTAEVERLDLRFGSLRGVRTAEGDRPLDLLVLAAGVEAPRLAAQAGVALPLVESPGILAHSAPADPKLERIVLAPEVHVRQVAGRVSAGVGFAGAGSKDTSREMGERILESVTRVLPAARDLALGEVTLGYRVLPKDGHPVLGFHPGAPGLYLASMHSGITLAPVVGRFAATEILDDVAVSLLADYRPTRFEPA